MIRYCVIHCWPDGLIPTIMPSVYKTEEDAGNWAKLFADSEIKPGHQYTAALLPEQKRAKGATYKG